MQTDFSVFRERLAEACLARNMTRDRLCRDIGLGGSRAADFLLVGLKTIDLYRGCQIADRLDVSLDWLLGRSEVMAIPKAKSKSRA